ncbi:hypothetical protein [Thauera sp.]|nr:hypothetical protein [Thauera sp.]
MPVQRIVSGQRGQK